MKRSRLRVHKKSFFFRHPTITLIIVVAFSFLCLIFFAEKFLEWQETKDGRRIGPWRVIRLREWNPNTSDIKVPNRDYGTVKPYRVRVDQNGFIKPKGEYHSTADLRIVFLGGSSTECLYVDEQNRFPAVVGTLLGQRTGLKVNSYNAGRSGNNTLHSINILLNKVVPVEPHIVVMMHNINDLITLFYEKSYWNPNPERSPLIVMRREGSLHSLMREAKNYFFPKLYVRLMAIFSRKKIFKTDEFAHLRGTKLVINREFIIDEFSKNLETFIYICKGRKIMPVLMTQQNRFTERPDIFIREMVSKQLSTVGANYDDWVEVYHKLNDVIREVGDKNNILVIDLAREVPSTSEFIYDPIHLNDKGCRFVGNIVSNELSKLIK